MELNRYTYDWRGDAVQIYAQDGTTADRIMAELLIKGAYHEDSTVFNMVAGEFTYMQK